MPAVLEAFPDARLLIAGDPFPRPQDIAYRQYLVGLIAQLKLQRAVILAGYVDEIADVYAASDLVVNPARVNEAFGRVAFEAAVAGRPAVVTRVGAVPELLRDDESALIVAPEDSAAIAAAALRLLDDAELVRAPGRRRPAGGRRAAHPGAQPGRVPARGRGDRRPLPGRYELLGDPGRHPVEDQRAGDADAAAIAAG